MTTDDRRSPPPIPDQKHPGLIAYDAGTLAICDPFATPSTSPWTGAAIIVESLRTMTCIVTRPRASTRPCSPFRPSDLRNDGVSVASAGADGIET